MKATGTKTAASTRVIVTIGVVISAIAARVASSGLQPRSRYFSTFSTTMIASSTTSPMASTSPISVSVLIEKPNAAIRPNVATSETGMATIGMRVVAESLQEDEDDDQDQGERLEQRVLDLGDVLVDVLGRVEGDPVLQVRAGSFAARRSISSRDLLDDRQRVGVRSTGRSGSWRRACRSGSPPAHSSRSRARRGPRPSCRPSSRRAWRGR